jgi:hypothetical protein
LVRNGDADIVSIESPFVGASQADLVDPVPGSTSEVGGLSSVGRGENTLSILEVISTEAGQAVTCSLVESVAVGTDSHTEAITIEPASVGALNTCFSGPSFAEEVAFGNN